MDLSFLKNEIFKLILKTEKTSYREWGFSYGLMGTELLLREAQSKLESSKIANAINQLAQARKNIFLKNQEHLSLWGGAAGSYFLDSLTEDGLDIDSSFYAKVKGKLNNEGKFELMSGAIGIGILALKIGDTQLLRIIDDYLFNLKSYRRLEDNSDVMNHHSNLSVHLDLGIPHGLSGLILFLSFHYELTRNNRCREHIEKTVDILLSILKENNSTIIPPLYPNPGKNIRNGWAYGNFATGFALFRAGISLNKPELSDIGKNLLIKGDLSHKESQVEQIMSIGNSGRLMILKEMLNHSNRNEIKNLFNLIKNEHCISSAENGILYGREGELLCSLSLESNSATNWETMFLLKGVS